MFSESAMHDGAIQISRHSHPWVGTPARTGVSQYTRVFQGTTTAQESRGFVCRTEESHWAASLALTAHEVRSGAVLLGSGSTEHQAIGPLPKPADSTAGTHHLETGKKKPACHQSTYKIGLNTQFFNTHRR